VPFVIALICATGLEPECAKRLRADCLSSASRGFVTLAYNKQRAHSRTAKTLRVRDGGTVVTPGGLIRLALRLTDPARQAAGSGALWAGVGEDGSLQAFIGPTRQMPGRPSRWAASHGLDALTDHGGHLVRLDLRRLRKSYKSRIYLQSGGVLDDFVSGHSRQIAASRYAGIGAHSEVHEQAVEAGLTQALAVALPPPAVATAGGAPMPTPLSPAPELSPPQAAAAASPDTDVFLASCTGFTESPFARTAGAPCPVAVWGCLECPNAVFTDRHLPSLTDFADWLQSRREVMSSGEWSARHGLAHQRLTTGIFPAFSDAQLRQARSAASSSGEHAATLPSRLLDQLT
jgi:hypothetical protein